MDFSNLKGLLTTNDSTELSDNDNDLEDELNAILSGQPVGGRPKQTTTSSAANKRIKQNPNKQSLNEMKAKKQNNSENEFGISNNLLNFDELALNKDFNEDMDDEDIDEDNEDLLSELNSIVSDNTSAKRVGNDYQFRRHENISNNEMQTKSGNDLQIKAENPFNAQHMKSNEIFNDWLKSETKSAVPVNRPQTSAVNANNSSKIVEPIKTQTTIESNFMSEREDKTTDQMTEIPRLNALKDEYKRAALLAKKGGQQTTALSHIKTAKQIEVLVKALEDGLSVDLSHLPPSPLMPTQTTGNFGNTSQSTQPLPQTNSNSETEIEIPTEELTTEDVKKFFNAPPPPNTVMEALEQRLNKFKTTQEEANNENNSSKARRLGRIVKQYETAIKDYKKGKVVDFDELPTPPGFAAIPKPTTSASSGDKSSHSNPVPPKPVPPKTAPKPTVVTNEAKNTNTPQKDGQQVPKTTPDKSDQKPVLKRASSTANKQLNYLLERQRLFKESALESKQKGDIQQAKEYLRMAKGFDPLIEATQNGLPIDATSIPTPPQMTEDFVIVSHPEASEGDDLEREEMYRKIEVELQNQIEMCKRNAEYFKQLGDISTASKFEKYVMDSRKDLDMLIVRWRTGQKVPNFKYETRTFSIVICNTEVGTNEVTVDVIKALDIPAKSDVDTYVRLEFPFPNDSIQSERTKTIKNNINPVFNETFKFKIDRKSRQLPRIFKRHPLKLELMSKGGFLRTDVLIGTALIKMNDFETKCTIHDSFPLTEGRKVVGGKIEAKVRVREPLLAKQVEEVKEKWLTFV